MIAIWLINLFLFRTKNVRSFNKSGNKSHTECYLRRISAMFNLVTKRRFNNLFILVFAFFSNVLFTQHFITVLYFCWFCKFQRKVGKKRRNILTILKNRNARSISYFGVHVGFVLAIALNVIHKRNCLVAISLSTRLICTCKNRQAQIFFLCFINMNWIFFFSVKWWTKNCPRCTFCLVILFI